MSHSYNPYTNVIDTMTKAMELGHIEIDIRIEILKKSPEGDKSISSC